MKIGTAFLAVGWIGVSGCAQLETQGVEDERRVEAKAPEVASDERMLLSEDGRYLVRWRPTPNPVPRNEPFDVEIAVFLPSDPAQPLTGCAASMSAGMPQHGHGMNRKPIHEQQEDHVRVTGLMFHMRGVWLVSVSVRGPEGKDRLQFEVEVG